MTLQILQGPRAFLMKVCQIIIPTLFHKTKVKVTKYGTKSKYVLLFRIFVAEDRQLES